MGLFFDANKYITRVESPRVNRSLSRKEQVLGYIDKYFDAFSTEYLQDVYSACRIYIEDTLEEDTHENTRAVTTPEMQAVTTIIKGLQDFIVKGEYKEMKYLHVLAEKEAFKLYCGMISKSLEMEIIDRKQAKRRIAKFYNLCDK